jgi:protein-ribulosamine 3-kinase
LSIPGQVRSWLADHGHGELSSWREVGGGCIHHGARLITSSGASFFLKQNRSVPPDLFAREAEGLEALKGTGGPAVPAPLLVGESFLLLEDLKPAAPRRGYWEDFGRQLAGLHLHTADRFGFEHDNYIGSTPQPNGWLEDGHRFFAERRLVFQAALAERKGLLARADAEGVEQLALRLQELVPAQPASLLHGDLWSGNALADSTGSPALIDPAAYYGWAEADLAMTALFGGFPESFYRAYQEARPLEEGWRQRFPIYNLYHLLNHLNLFGTGYLGQVKEVLRMYR